MTAQVSTEFKTLLLAAFPSIFNGGHIRVFGGSQPPSPDYAEGSAPIAIITRHGIPVGAGAIAGLTFAASGPYVVMSLADVWTLVAIADGTATWFRLVADPNDPGDASIMHARIDGAIGTDPTACELALPITAFLSGDAISPLSFFYSIPPVLG